MSKAKPSKTDATETQSPAGAAAGTRAVLWLERAQEDYALALLELGNHGL